MIMKTINLSEKFAKVQDYWNPRVLARLNGQDVRIAKIKGTFVWHQHENEDELFWVHKGKLSLEFRDHTITLEAGEMAVVPRGVEHRPVATEEVELIMFEPSSTVNTGGVQNEFTKTDLEDL